MGYNNNNIPYLHSTMVLLKSGTSDEIIVSTEKSTFHYGSIKIFLLLDKVLYCQNLHSTMVLLKLYNVLTVI